jgi:CubicO group peptidase (beta-lactamase class C family)
MPYAIARGDIPGAVVVVVKDGKVLAEKGYGYSDLKTKKPVDPATTLFRPGSVSKLFTWTAVMQLVEAKKIDLDADVNQYLDFKIPAHSGPPITMRNLMTHTPGFDEIIRSLIVTDPKDLVTLEQALKYRVPERVTDAGSTPAYSNYGAGLAGYIVQRISGQSFDDYLETHIFQPLGMTHATFRQPLPAAMVPLMSQGYKPGSPDPQKFEMIALAPAGALSASGGDMGRFMIAHLQKGELEGKRILGEATAKEMHETPSRVFPALNGMALGFYQSDLNGHRVIAHAGDTEFFHSDLNLFIDDGVGVFVSFNSAGKEGTAQPLRVAVVTDFADRYFPDRQAPAATLDAKTAKEHAALMAGRYVFSRRSHTSFIAALNLVSQAKVIPNPDGTITIADLKGLNDQPKKWREVAPFVWQDVDGGERLAAQVDGGRVVRFGYGPYPFMLFEPVPWWASSAWLVPLLIVAVVALLLTVLAWPISALVRRHYKVAYALSGRDAIAHRRIRIAALLVVLLMVAVGTTLGLMFSDFKYLTTGVESWVAVLRFVSLVVFVLAAAVALWNASVVLRSQRGWPAKVWCVVLAVSCLTMLWIGIVFKLAGFGGSI